MVEVGYFGAGQFIPCEELSAGMVGYLTASIKNVNSSPITSSISSMTRSGSALGRSILLITGTTSRL